MNKPYPKNCEVLGYGFFAVLGCLLHLSSVRMEESCDIKDEYSFGNVLRFE
jgi:hypothetical protein